MPANLSDKKDDLRSFRASVTTLSGSQWERENGHTHSEAGVFFQIPTNSYAPGERVLGVKRVPLISAEELAKGGLSDQLVRERIDTIMRETVVRMNSKGDVHLDPESPRYTRKLDEAVMDARASSRVFIENLAHLKELRDQLNGPNAERVGRVEYEARVARGEGAAGQQFEALLPAFLHSKFGPDAQITKASPKALEASQDVVVVSADGKAELVKPATAAPAKAEVPAPAPVNYIIDLKVKDKADAIYKQTLLEKMGFATDKGGADGKVDGYFQKLSKQAAEDFREKLSDAAFVKGTDPKILEEAKIAFGVKESRPLSSKEVAEVSAAIGAANGTSRTR